jgi:hypothetical protein
MGRPSTVVITWKPRLEEWLGSRQEEFEAQNGSIRIPSLPSTNDGMINLTAIAQELGCPKAYLYDYPELQSLVDLFAEAQQLRPSGGRNQSAADLAVRERAAAIAKASKADAAAALEARAALGDALRKLAVKDAEICRLQLENESLRERLNLMTRGILIRVAD